MTNGNLIKALDLCKKYVKETGHDFHCEHEKFYFGIEPAKVHPDDMKALKELGVFVDSDVGLLAAWVSA